jgi:hypothetical protein
MARCPAKVQQKLILHAPVVFFTELFLPALLFAVFYSYEPPITSMSLNSPPPLFPPFAYFFWYIYAHIVYSCRHDTQYVLTASIITIIITISGGCPGCYAAQRWRQLCVWRLTRCLRMSSSLRRNELESSMSAAGEDERRNGVGRARIASASASVRMSRSARRQHVASASPMQKRKTTPLCVSVRVGGTHAKE